MNLDLTGKKALVLGGGTGLGRGISVALAENGANVAIASRNINTLEKAATEIGGGRNNVTGFAVDLADEASVSSLIQELNSSFGSLDIVVLNGGGPPPGSAAITEPALWRNQFEAMFLSAMRITSAVLPEMRERKWGRIIAVGSTSVREPIPELTVSNALRAGVAGWMKTLASEVASDSITVNMLLPGRLLTDRTQQFDVMDAEDLGITPTEMAVRSQAEIPMGRYGTPSEFGAVAAFLASPAASYVTGTAIPVDGGLSRGMI